MHSAKMELANTVTTSLNKGRYQFNAPIKTAQKSQLLQNRHIWKRQIFRAS
jgi:hypothetical protein